MAKSILFGLAFLTFIATTSANASELTVKDPTREYRANNPAFLGYISGLVKGAIVHLALIQNDCSPDGNRFEVTSVLVDRIAQMHEIQSEPIDLAFYAISLRHFACDKGEFYRYLPQLSLSD
jgi:hypothetical protein